MKILLVDQCTPISRRLERSLAAGGDDITVVVPEASLVASLDDSYACALVVLERFTPALLERTLVAPGVPVLVFCQELQPAQVVLALDSGIDDIISSPVRLGEIAARLRALVRRADMNTGACLEVGDLRIDTDAHRAWRALAEVHLSGREFDLLETFMRNPGRVLTRPVLLEAAWDVAYENASNVVDQYVGHLRRKIDRPFGRNDLKTVRGAGYRLDVA